MRIRLLRPPPGPELLPICARHDCDVQSVTVLVWRPMVGPAERDAHTDPIMEAEHPINHVLQVERLSEPGG